MRIWLIQLYLLIAGGHAMIGHHIARGLQAMDVGGDGRTTAWPKEHCGAHGLIFIDSWIASTGGRVHFAAAIGADVVAAQPAQNAVLVEQVAAGQTMDDQHLILIVGHVEADRAVRAAG